MRLRHRGVTCKAVTGLRRLATVSSICPRWSRRSSLFSVPSEERKMISGCVARNSAVKAERRPDGCRSGCQWRSGHSRRCPVTQDRLGPENEFPGEHGRASANRRGVDGKLPCVQETRRAMDIAGPGDCPHAQQWKGSINGFSFLNVLLIRPNRTLAAKKSSFIRNLLTGATTITFLEKGHYPLFKRLLPSWSEAYRSSMPVHPASAFHQSIASCRNFASGNVILAQKLGTNPVNKAVQFSGALKMISCLR